MYPLEVPIAVEQVATYQFPGLEVQLILSVEIPGEAGVSVVSGLPSKFDIPDELRDTLAQYLHDGVHGGIASVDLIFPDGGMRVIISMLKLTPSLNASTSDQELKRIGSLLQTLITYSVAALWEGMYQIGSDKGVPDEH